MPRHPTDCRYFANGICSKGNACAFVHDVATRNENICQFNLAGKCSYGQACRFKHQRPRNNEDHRQSTSGSSSSTRPSSHIPSLMSATSTTTTTPRVRPIQLLPPTTDFNPKAQEFVPSWKKVTPSAPITSYAAAAASGSSYSSFDGQSSSTWNGSYHQESQLILCPYFEKNGECQRKTGDDCPFVHGEYCDMCNTWSLHPFNDEKRRQHQNACLDAHTHEMERAFMLQKTEQKTCGICMENIFEKGLRFGILNGCQHCFCLDCIRLWRTRDQESLELNTKTVRSCPECRQHSDYVIPSLFWVENGQEKDLLIEMYKENTKAKVCKYYSNTSSRGNCPFGNKCFYKHQLPDGSIDPGESPHARRRARLADFLFDSDTDSSDDVSHQIATAEDNADFRRFMEGIEDGTEDAEMFNQITSLIRAFTVSSYRRHAHQ